MKIYFIAVLFLSVTILCKAQNVGIGTNSPTFKLDIKSTLIQANNNTHLLNLIGSNPVLNFSDPTNAGYGYIKSWTTAFNPGYSAGMEMGAPPGRSLFFSTNYNSTMIIGNNDNVGIGSQPTDFKLAIHSTVVQSNTNTHLLSLKGQNPVLSFINENNSSYGYIKMWNYAPFPPYTNGMVIGASPGYPLFFSSNNYGVTMTVADNGNVGIGTTTPAAKLQVNGSGEVLRLSGTTPFLSFYDAEGVYKGYLWNNTDDMVLGTVGNGNLLLNSNTGQVAINGSPYASSLNSSLTVNGRLTVRDTQYGSETWSFDVNSFAHQFIIYQNVTVRTYLNEDGDWIAQSDIRLKQNIAQYKPVLDAVKKLNISTYEYKSHPGSKKSFGLIAQNVLESFPEIVSESSDKDGKKFLGIAYSKTGVLALKAVQEQQQVIESLQQKIEHLEKLVTELLNK